ncbi:MAG: helix-turn-helix transcriptional regulator [Gemmatimonadota bacterium]
MPSTCSRPGAFPSRLPWPAGSWRRRPGIWDDGRTRSGRREGPFSRSAASVRPSKRDWRSPWWRTWKRLLYAPLSDREVEVLALVARGRTNADIAETLFLSPHTVKRHVANILTKLDVPTRSAAVGWAARRGVLPGRQD